MNLQPLAPPPREISVTEPITPAYERVKQILFKPFDLAKWVTIGFCAWLAGLGEGGGGGNFNFSGGDHHHVNANGGNPAEQFRHFYWQARDYVLANAFWIIPLAIVVVLLAVAVWVLVLWLSSRGKFMFLHCVALDRAEVAVPWSKFAAAASRLFWFRLILGLVAGVLMLPLLAICALVILRMVLRNEVEVAGIMMAVALVLGMIFLAILLAVVRKFLGDFVVPILFLRGGSCVAAWREFLTLLAANAGKFALYLLFQIVLNIAIGALVLLVVVCTCCVAGCVLLLPFLGTVALLPVLVFKRAYPLYYLAQYGPQYDVFPASPAPAPSPLPPPPAG